MKKRALALMSTALVAALALGGCAGGTESTPDESASTLRIGALGNTSDNLDPLTVNGFADYIAVGHLYEMLVELRDGVAHFSLAQDITSNDDATEWTITLVEDATFSDGSPVSAQDVAYSLRLLGDPATSPNYASFYQDIDPNGFEIVDDKTSRGLPDPPAR